MPKTIARTASKNEDAALQAKRARSAELKRLWRARKAAEAAQASQSLPVAKKAEPKKAGLTERQIKARRAEWREAYPTRQHAKEAEVVKPPKSDRTIAPVTQTSSQPWLTDANWPYPSNPIVRRTQSA